MEQFFEPDHIGSRYFPEWRAFRDGAKSFGSMVHDSNIFEFCVVKRAELPHDDLKNKFEDRPVLDGTAVKNDHFDVALFNDLGSSLFSVQADNAVYSHDLQPGYALEQADAKAAYTQCDLQGAQTWFHLLNQHGRRQPDSWFHINTAVNRGSTHEDPQKCLVWTSGFWSVLGATC